MRRLNVQPMRTQNWYQTHAFRPLQLMAPPQLPNTCVHTRSHLSPNLLALPPHVFSSSGSDPHDGCQARLLHNPFVLVM
ncbi:hypothetical protein DPX16_20013 [Anabarilius grahami]|uniref:Uncharacterized protein n=1 Tax=Anabarilius grahami TaxID=495550 RepID=A0A3N0Z5I8_ANAGA|nr:hypothetical protein DPX16_20013 [Anabarilius grahami]